MDSGERMKHIYRAEYTSDLGITLSKFGVTEKVIISILQQEIFSGSASPKSYDYIVVYKETVEEQESFNEMPRSYGITE